MTIGIIMLVAAVCLLLQLPAVQKYAVQKALNRIESSIDGRLELDGIQVQPFDAVLISGLRIVDDNPYEFDKRQDTLFAAGKVYADFDLRSLLGGKGIHVGKVTVEDALFSLVTESGQYNSNLARIFRIESKEKKEKKKNEREIFSIRRLSLKNIEFRKINAVNPSEPKEYGMNWSDLDLCLSGEGHSIRMAGGIVSFAADKLELTEKSGYHAGLISGYGRTGGGETLVNEFRFEDDHTKLYLPEFLMKGDGFSNFFDNVSFDVTFGRGCFSPATISAFTGMTPMEDIVVDISRGSVSGPLSNLRVANLEFTEQSSSAHCLLNGSVRGLPRIKECWMDVSAELDGISSKGIEKLIASAAPDSRIDLNKFADGQEFTLKLNGKGPMDALALQADLSDGSGSLALDMNLNGVTAGSPSVKGHVRSADFDLGRIAGVSAVGRCSMESGLEASFGKKGTSMRIDSLNIAKLGLLGYEYRNILANGTFDGTSFDGRVICSDPNLNFMLQGLISMDNKSKKSVFNFIASVGYADLHAMNIDSRPVSKVSLNSLRADFSSMGKGIFDGDINASGLVFENQAGLHDIGDIAIHSVNKNKQYSMRLDSDFANADYRGSVNVADIVQELKNISVGRELYALFGSEKTTGSGEQAELDIRFHDSRDLMAFIKPGLYIADSTRIHITADRNGVLGGSISSPRLALDDKYLRKLSIDLDNQDNSLNCKLYADEINIMPALNFKNGSLLLYANDNNVGIGCYYDNGEDNRADIYLTADLLRDDSNELMVNAQSLASNIYLNGERWNIKPSKGNYSKGGFHVDRLCIESGEQSITLDGGVSKEHRDSMKLDLGSLNLEMINSFLAGKYELGGHATGEVLLLSPIGYEDELGLSMDLTVEDAWLGGFQAGTLFAESSWNEETRSLDVRVRDIMDNASPLTLEGSYTPSTKRIRADANMDGFEIGYFAPLASSVFSALEGKLSGRFHVDGSPSKLGISSNNSSIHGGMMQVAYTGVPYYLDGGLMVNDRGVFFNDMAIRDSRSGKGNVFGGIVFNNFKDMRMDMQMRFEDMECTRMVEKAGNPVYGRLYGTGRLNISGPFKAIFLDGEITTSSRGNLHIPLNSVSNSGKSDLLVFKEPERPVYIDPYDIMMNRMVEEKAKKSDFGMRFKISATPNVDVSLEIDKSSGHALTGRGSGAFTLEVRPARDLFSINGDYTLNSGDYHFAAMGIAQRDFSIQDGSSVKFNGDIMESDLNIDARYTTKASLSNLIADTTSVSSRRTVECDIHISDKIRNPALEFSINVPDLDPVTKSRVESALNTEDKIQKQFVALLISNNFLPDEQSGVTNNSTSMLYSNVAEIMANQLNTILQKLDIPLDLGLNYQATQSGTSIFDVAISTQLFNNRAVINGTIGNRQRSGNEDVVGDIDIEIKLDKTGQLRLTLFSHSADDYTNYLDNSQRSGVGVAYQKEFSSLSEFFRRLFMSKSKRNEEDRLKATTTEETVVMGIE